MALDDVIWAGHPANSRGYFAKQIIQDRLSEQIHVPVVNVENLPVFSRVVYFIRHYGLFIDYIKVSVTKLWLISML